MPVLTRIKKPIFSFLTNRRKSRATHPENNAHVCMEIFNSVCVLANGDVICSCRDDLSANVLGNLKQNRNRITDIFKNDNYNKLRAEIGGSEQNAYCPAIKDECCFKNVPCNLVDMNIYPKIEILQLETISYCNLKCPLCPATQWASSDSGRLGILPMDIIESLFEDTKNTLHTLLLYNYGEPFLDKRILEILRLAKRIVPNAYIGICSNGTILPAHLIETIVKEQLVSRINFSIDGASQETYGKYRVGGSFEKAFNNMAVLNNYNKMHEGSQLRIYWQYILFEWNDSDQEIQRAIDLATEHGLTIQWTLTSSPGKSKRYTPGSSDFMSLQGGIKHLCRELETSRIEKPGRS